MKQNLVSGLTKTLALAGAFPVPMTDTETLHSFIKTLHPIQQDKELIRLGPNGDGGYLVPDDLGGIEACFSPGVSNVSGFERDCANRGMKIFLADKSVDAPGEQHELFEFTKKFIGSVSDEDFMTLDEWVNTRLVDSAADLMLQMDIEGYEYEVLLSTSQKLMTRFRILVIEFHDLDQLWNRPFFNIVSQAFRKILKTHWCIHIHPNNCCGSVTSKGIEIPRMMEFTFLRRDRMDHEPTSFRTDFPHPLDRDNTDTPPLELPDCWYRGTRQNVN